jgi:hypothetical protein
MTYQAIQEIERLVRSFENRQLPRSQWTHQAHLMVALWYLIHHPQSEAIERIQSGIRRYNQAMGIESTKTSGYHETMTLFWIYKIQEVLLQEESVHESTVALWNQVLQRCSNPKLPLQYYSPNRLMSWQARSTWVEPDLRPLF